MKSLVVSLCLVLAVGAAHAVDCLSDWPEEADPLAVSQKLTDLFLSTRPERYKPVGHSGKLPYSDGKVPYAVVSLWVNALECAHLTGDVQREQALIRLFDDFLPGGPKHHMNPKPYHVDDNIFGALPYEIYLLNRDPRCLTMGAYYADTQWTPPCEGSLTERHALPKEVQEANWKAGYTPQTRFWIDDMYMIIAIQSQAYRATGDRRYIDRTAKEMCLYLDKLQLKEGPAKGLFYHAPDAPFVWGRGAGWMAAGMAMVLKFLPEDSEFRPRILAGYRDMMAALLRFRRADGLWGQLVNEPETWTETSGSAMYAYAFVAGVRRGWLDAATYGPAARKAYLALCAKLDRHGNVPGVCMGTGKRNDHQFYLDRPRIDGDPHGQAPMLWICAELLQERRGDEYVVVDLKDGPNAKAYPVRRSATGPDPKDSRCRTTELWLRRVAAGSFTMGSPADEPGHDFFGKETEHRVTVSKPYYIGVFEITQKQYELVTGLKPSHFSGLTLPVENVSYADLRGRTAGAAWPRAKSVDPDSFFGKLRRRTGLAFDLPTEAMWEFACRIPADADLDRIARHSGNCPLGDGLPLYMSAMVGTYEPNALGLYDMLGNVAEWCLDWYQDDLGAAAATDPSGPDRGLYRTIRGGSYFPDEFSSGPKCCRTAFRTYDNIARTTPETRLHTWGFRAAMRPGEAVAADNDAPIPPPERSPLFVKHVDAESGVESWLLRPGFLDFNQQGIYFTADSMTEDGRFLFFWASKDEGEWSTTTPRPARRPALADLKFGEVYDLKDFPPGIPYLDVKADKIYGIDRSGVHCRDLLADPQKDILVCPLPAELKDGKGNPLSRLATHITLTRDRRHAFLDTSDGTTCSRPGLLDLKTGAFKPWRSEDINLNHGQICPTDDGLAIVACDGCWDFARRELTAEQLAAAGFSPTKGSLMSNVPRPKDLPYPRLWLCRADGSLRMVPPRIQGYATHENFTKDGTGMTFCGGDRGFPASGLHLHDVATDVQRLVVPYGAEHGGLSPDNRFAAFDLPSHSSWRGNWWRVGFWDRDTHRGIWIHTKMPTYRLWTGPSRIHPDAHPSFACGGRYVVTTLYDAQKRMNVSLTSVEHLKAKLAALPPLEPKRFPIAWDPSARTDVPYEYEFDSRRQVEECRVAAPMCGRTMCPTTAYAVEATVGGETRRLAVTALPGQCWRNMVLRFRVPEGTTALTLVADVTERFEMRDTVTCDNLFAGKVEPEHPFGVADRRFELEVGEALRGRPVKLEWRLRNRSGKPLADVARATAYRADGTEIGRLFVPALAGAYPDEKTRFLFGADVIPAETAKLVLDVAGEGAFLTTRLVLREAATLGAGL